MLLLSVTGSARAGEPFKPGKLPKDVVAKLQPGLTLRFYADATAKDPLDVRRSRLAALHVPHGTPPTPWLPPGPFHARTAGLLKTSLKTTCTFHVDATGVALLRINGQPAKGAVELAKGYNLVEIDYTSPPKGDATLRVSWTGEGFATEPLPPESLFSRGDDAILEKHSRLREGRLLYATHGCAQCHALPGKVSRADCAMPELAQRAPALDNAAHRVHYDWLVRWIANPRALRPDATMPHVLHGPDALVQAGHLAMYLSSLKDKAFAAAADDAKLVKQGAKLFAAVGCVTCHHFGDPKQADPLDRLSLHHVRAKFRPGALQAFLRAPHEHAPWTRMPDFALSVEEANALAAFVRDSAKGRFDPVPKGDPAIGAKLFREVGCGNCHAVRGVEPVPLRAAPSDAAKGCLAGVGQGPAPRFALSDQQRIALRDFLATDGVSLTRETPAEFAARQMGVLQCASCHRRDGALTRWHSVLEDDGVLPEALPSLTWTGEKLKPEWTARLLAGKHDHRARPWLKARMPAFPAWAEMLALGLSHEHGFAAADDPRPKHDPALAAIGQKLVPQMGGFNCVQCHAVGKTPPTAPFEAPGINLLDAAQRLRYSYYPRWMLDPPRVDSTTRMPRVSMDGQTTPLRDVLKGDARRQFDALWHYIQALPK